MKQRIISIAAALALCLGLLPGTAWAAEPSTGVTIAYQANSVTLTDRKFYVAPENKEGITEVDTAPEDDPYLAYSGGTLTVHGAFETTATIYVNSDLTITGGAGSSLNVTAANGYTVQLGNNSTLTLDGGVNFTANSSSGPVIYTENRTVTFAAADSYSGKIVLSHTDGRTPAVHGATLDVQNSGSIEIRGQMSTGGQSNVLNSKGNISIKPGVPLSGLLSIKGADVELIIGSNVPVFTGQSLDIVATGDVLITNENEDTYSPAPALFGSAEISAGGNVTISSKGIPASSMYGVETTCDLTVKNAKNVTITGDSSNSRAFFAVPVTFEKCGSVTVTDSTDSANKPLMEAGVTVTSDKPWTATTGEKTVTLPSGEWHYGGDTTEPKNQYVLSLSSTGSAPTCWKAGEGWIYYEPAADGSSPNKLTLDNATYESSIRASNTNDLTVTAKGSNQIHEIGSTGNGSGSVTVKTEGGGTLNALVYQMDTTNQKSSTTVYGKVELTTGYALGPDVGGFETSMTIAPGAEATIPSNANLSIFDTTYLTNNGTIVNIGTVSLRRAAAENATSETVKGLGLSGSGSVTVEKANPDGSGPITDTYTNSGTKLLDPAGDSNGELDLSSADTTDANWTTQGYKWEVTKGTDGSGNEIITSAKLTLTEGFNATTVTLPDAAVTIVTTGESRIGTLTPPGGPNNAHADKLKLTFSGTGPLTITEHVEISGGSGNIITVDEGAKVTVNHGISIGASGGIDSTITVNGTLTAAQGTGTSAIYGGKVEIGNTGVLEVSGENGVQLNGMTGSFTNLFTVAGNGRFTADCSKYNIRVNFTNADDLPKDEAGNPDAKAVINLGPEYMPEGCKVVLGANANHIKLVRISNNEELTGPLTIHKNHTWANTWTDGGGDTHYHACTFEGCTAKQPGSELPHYYAHGADACRDCGHARPAGAPDSDSGGSGSSGGGSSGSSGSSSYTVTVEEAEHGKVTSDRRTASRGDTVTLTVTAHSGYALNTLTVTDSRGNEVALAEKGGEIYTFTMPGRAVTVKAAFAPLPDDTEAPCTGGAECPSRAFSDLDTGEWYHEAVDYVLQNDLMGGYGGGRFGPDDNLTRAQFAQILFNREGRPAVNYLLQYSDVADGAWYTEAVRWAASQGIVSGYGNGMFGPDDNITREQLAVMLWRYAGSPAAAEAEVRFTDAEEISGYALDALRWAVENGIINGCGNGRLAPQGPATRAQVAQMLKNYLER